MVGQLVGLVAGIAAVWLLGAGAEPSVLITKHPGMLRVWASVLAIALTALGQDLLKAHHAPATATTLLITLGAFDPAWRDVSALLVGIVIITVTGMLARRLRWQQPGQI